MAVEALERPPTSSDRCGQHPRPLSIISSATTFVDGDFDDKLDEGLSAKSSVAASTWSDSAYKQADSFVHDKGPQIHPIFSHLTTCEEQKAEKKPSTIEQYRQEAPTEHFYRVIEAHRRHAKEYPFLNEFNIRKTHTWEEVFRTANLAQEECTRDERRSFLKNLGRVTQRSAPALGPWLELIPNGNYTSALYGGLKIAFNIAKRIGEQRVHIVETFGQIPETIRRAEDRLKEWPKDEVLYDAATDLYLAVLKAVEAMIMWLVGRSAWKKIGSVLTKPQSSTPMDLGFDDLKQALERLSTRATTLQYMAIARTDANTQKIKSEVNAINISTHTSERMTVEMYKVMTDTQNDVQRVEKIVKEAHDGTVPFLIDQLRNSEMQKIAQERRHERDMRSLRKENQALKLKEEAERAYRTQHSNTHRMLAPILTQEQLALLLETFPDMVEPDLTKVIKKGKKSAPASQSRGHWLLHNKKFQAWLTIFAVKTLMVNGNARAYDKISAVSYACALIVRSLEMVENVVTISFFCGLHTSEKDSLDGPTGLLKALISQLMGLQQFDLTFVNLQYEQGLRSLEFTYLTDLLRKLVEQLPDDLTLFCIIDGTSFYDKRRYNGELEAVIRMLYEIAEDPETTPIFKLLIVSPAMSKSAKAIFLSSNRLIVPTDAGNGQLLNSRQAKRRISDRMRIQEEAVESASNVGLYEPKDEGSDETKVDFNERSISISESSCEDGEDRQHDNVSLPGT